MNARRAWSLGVLWLSACGISLGPSRPIDDAPPPRTADDNNYDDGFLAFFDAGPAPSAPPPARLGDVVTPAKRPPAISGGTLAVSQDGAWAVAADPDRDLVYVVKMASKASTTLTLAANSEPSRVALDDRGMAHVVLRGTGELAHIELSSQKLLSTTHVCDLPRGVAHDAKSGSLVVACASGDVVWLSAADYSERQRAFVDRDLRDVVPTEHALYVTRYRSAELLRLDAMGAILSRVSPPQSKATRFPQEVFLRANGAVVTPHPTPLLPLDNTLLEATMTPTLAWRAIPGPDDTVLTLHQRSQIEEVSVQPGGYGSACNTITEGAATLVGADGAGAPATGFSDSTVVVDAALSPDGAWIVVAAPGNYLQNSPTVMFYSAHYGVGGHEHHEHGHHGADAGTPPSQPDAGDAATLDAGTSFPPCGFASYTLGLDVQATAVAFDGKGHLYIQSREPASLSVHEIITDFFDGQPGNESVTGSNNVASITLNTRSARDTGHDLFHANAGSGLACASCHGEALDDGHVWNFTDIGPRRTQNMRGGFLETAPFHWDGDMATFKHLVDNVMTGRMGGFAVEPRYADALSGWIEALPALRPSARDAASVARGEVLFASSELECTSCHTGTTFTNNLKADVGTGGTFQVPSLRGLGLRAPYMHDGCAKTLLERFDPACGGDKHGKVSQLSAQDLGDLAAYLETL